MSKDKRALEGSTGVSGSGSAATLSRVLRSKDSARKSYDRLSRWYDLLAGASERRARELGLAQLAAQEGERILEIGFGTGQGLAALARAVGATGRVHGIDLSPGMLQVAASRLRRLGLRECVALQTGDAAALQFRGVPLDAIFLCFTLELFDTPEIPIVLQRCWEALRPGGRVVVVALSNAGPPTLARRLYDWLHARLPALFDCRPINPGAALAQAGFQLAEISQLSMWGLPLETLLAIKAQAD